MNKINESQKWPTDKAKYDKNYEKIFGSTKVLICKYCKGKRCPACNWMGGFEAKPTSSADNVKVGDEQR